MSKGSVDRVSFYWERKKNESERGRESKAKGKERERTNMRGKKSK